MPCYLIATTLLVLGLTAGPAFAVSYNPLIDFRDASIWSDANYQGTSTDTQAGITLTLEATPNPATLWWDELDGIGVRLSYENDEIESDEILQVVFHHAVSISVIYISDLFEEHGYVETGGYRINGGDWITFDAASLPGSGSNGEHAIFLNDANDAVSLVEFSAPGLVNGENHEFALMGFDARGPTGTIPEPTAALLFGAGMLIASSVTTHRAR